MTLKDIAVRAGVSVSTVSRILNDKETKAASREVRERLWQIIRETGYVPDRNAQNLRLSEKAKERPDKFIATVFARVSDSNDLFFTELASAIEFEVYKKGYTVKCSFYAADLNDKSFMTILKDQSISGLAVLGRFENESAIKIMNEQRNVVYVGLNPTGSEHDLVFCDGHKASMMAVGELIELGHKKIAYIGEKNKEVRYSGYTETIRRHELELDPRRIIESKQSLEGGYTGARKLCDGGADFSAVFCANDATAMGCIKYLREHNIKVPGDASVISIDDVEMSRYFMPMLTTVHIPINEMGKQAAKLLIDRIEKGHSLPVKMELPFSISNRNSCSEYSGG